MQNEDNSIINAGRQLSIREVLDELDPADRAIIVAMAEEISTQVILKGMRAGQSVRFSPGDALELLWEYLIFETDTHGKHRLEKLALYAQNYWRIRGE